METETITIIISAILLLLCVIGSFARVEHRLTKLETLMEVLIKTFNTIPKRKGD